MQELEVGVIATNWTCLPHERLMSAFCAIRTGYVVCRHHQGSHTSGKKKKLTQATRAEPRAMPMPPLLPLHCSDCTTDCTTLPRVRRPCRSPRSSANVINPFSQKHLHPKHLKQQLHHYRSSMHRLSQAAQPRLFICGGHRDLFEQCSRACAHLQATVAHSLSKPSHNNPAGHKLRRKLIRAVQVFSSHEHQVNGLRTGLHSLGEEHFWVIAHCTRNRECAYGGRGGGGVALYREACKMRTQNVEQLLGWGETAGRSDGLPHLLDCHVWGLQARLLHRDEANSTSWTDRCNNE